MTTTLSKTISALRTILCFQIVFLHAAMTGLTNQELSASYDGSYAIYKYLSTALTLTTRTAVPLFFIISGYLFFINYKNTFIDYKKHLKTRAKHLLQPIIIWTTLYLLLYYIAQKIPYTASLSLVIIYLSKITNGKTLSAHIQVFSTTSMFVGQFWFLRNLFIMCVFSPLLWYSYKYTKHYSLYVIGGIWFFHKSLNINIYIIDTIFFFTLGACAH